jgi:hypothetical protein
MLDRAARNHLAERLRHLASGLMSNHRFEDLSQCSADGAVSEVDLRFAWLYYDDMNEHRLTGGLALTYGQRRDFARVILFLKTDFEYEWASKRGFRAFLNSTFRLIPLRQIPPMITAGGDLRVWPFYRKEDYLAALKSRPYCGGLQH